MTHESNLGDWKVEIKIQRFKKGWVSTPATPLLVNPLALWVARKSAWR